VKRHVRYHRASVFISLVRCLEVLQMLCYVCTERALLRTVGRNVHRPPETLLLLLPAKLAHDVTFCKPEDCFMSV
jgi:hypothetical protein